MTYRFTVTGAFGKVTTEELRLNNPKQIKQIKEFMLVLAPEIAQSSLRVDRDPQQNAEITMRWAMHLAVVYETFRTIAAADLNKKQDAPPSGEQGPGDPSPRIQQTQARVSAAPPPLHAVRGSSHGNSP